MLILIILRVMQFNKCDLNLILIIKIDQPPLQNFLMNIFLEAYLIALFIFLHFSLLLCKQPQCFFDSKQVLVLPSLWQEVLVNLFTLIPIKLEYIQLVAQFCLFGDVILFGMIALKIVGNIIKNLLIIIGITCLIMLVLYGLSNYNDATGQKILAEARKFIEDLFKKNPLSK